MQPSIYGDCYIESRFGDKPINYVDIIPVFEDKTASNVDISTYPEIYLFSNINAFPAQTRWVHIS